MINNTLSRNSIQKVNQDIPDTTPIPELKLSAEDQKRVDALNKELDEIFGSHLTDAEKQKEKELMNAIDKILEKTEPPLTKAEEDQLNSLHQEIAKLFEDGKLTTEEEEKLTTLEASIDKLLESHKPQMLSDADQEKLDQLFDSLGKLYRVEPPSKEELARAEEIYSELHKIYVESAGEPSIQSILGKDISAENLAKLNGLLTEIQKTLADGANLPDLSEEDRKEVDAIHKQIEELLGNKAQQEDADKIHKQIEELFEDGIITAEEEVTLTKLGKQLEELSKPKELSDADKEQLEDLFSQLDKIYEKQTPTQESNDKLIKLTQELEGFLQEIFPEKNAAELGNLIIELQSLGSLDETMADGNDAAPTPLDELGTNFFSINEIGNLYIEDFNPSEGDILVFDQSLGLESQEHLASLVSEITQDDEDLVVDFAHDDDVSITLIGVSLDEISWGNVVVL